MFESTRRRMLLELLAQRAIVLPATAENWQELLVTARQHRLQPLLQWRLAAHPQARTVPAEIRATLNEEMRMATRRSLGLRCEIVGIHELLASRGIPAVFLKGAFLAFHAYPHPALRPLRDVDVLVPQSQSIAAFELLQSAGFSRISLGAPAAAASCHKHLPPLQSACGEFVIEVHSRLFDLNPACTVPDLAEDPAVWRRLIHVGSGRERVAYLSATDQLLHLIVHSLFDHHLNNGPLTLTDIAFLLETNSIEWPLFWRMAHTGGWARGSWLLLSAVDRLYRPLKVTPPPFANLTAVPDRLIHAVETLMLAEPQRARNTLFSVRLRHADAPEQRVRLLLGRLFPPPVVVAALQANSTDTLSLTRAYVRHWWRLASVRLPDLLAQRRVADHGEHVAALAGLRTWLAQ
jgi:Uncharacterised nucleotidyltransferase